MNDRFKFRVWDKRRNKFIESPEPTPMLQANGLLAYFKDAEYMNNYVVQFCTGLKDKNGKLIYEGDVVKYICDSDWCADGYHQCIDCYSGENFKIYWNEDFCKFQYAPYDENEFNFDIDEDAEICLEVIGNIYENKELLNENS